MKRLALLVSVDPSDNLDENHSCHEKAKTTIDRYRSDRRFDLATLRMVAEHIEKPDALAARARVMKTGGKVVIYTPNRWSPVTLLARLIPFRFHHHFIISRIPSQKTYFPRFIE